MLARPSRMLDSRPLVAGYWPQLGEKPMDWFSKKTSIAGVDIPNWAIALVVVVVILLLYRYMR
jgi:hypothetical protein